MRKAFIIIFYIIILAVIIACPLLLYIFVFEQEEFFTFLTNYIAIEIGSIVSITGIFITICYTEKQIALSKRQFDEQNRLNNRPILDLQIIGIGDKDADTISMNCEYTLKNNVPLQEAVVEFQIFNVGLGAALDIKYGIKIDGKLQDGVFWKWDNHILKNNDNFVQKLSLMFPKNKEYTLELLIFYDDILNNHYVKTVGLLNQQTEQGAQMLCILSQDKGSICNVNIKNMYYVVSPAGEDKEVNL